MDVCLLLDCRCAIEDCTFLLDLVCIHLTTWIYMSGTMCTVAQSPCSYAGVIRNRDQRKQNSFATGHSESLVTTSK